jgi:hypothetical protein
MYRPIPSVDFHYSTEANRLMHSIPNRSQYLAEWFITSFAQPFLRNPACKSVFCYIAYSYVKLCTSIDMYQYVKLKKNYIGLS